VLLRFVFFRALLALLGLMVSLPLARADDENPPAAGEPPYRKPVVAIASNRFSITVNGNRGDLPFYATGDFEGPLPEVNRAVVVIHGRLRNAGAYFQSAITALSMTGEDRAHTLILAPQFIADLDAEVRHAPANLLRWKIDGWQGGEDALGPASISSFEVLDALFARLADKSAFPNLSTVVLAGHSGGAEVVQRYAILGRGARSRIRVNG